jgi:phosphoribosylformylglycinamidine synthase
VIGIVGILEDVSKAVPADFQREGDAVVLIQSAAVVPAPDRVRELGSSTYANSILNTGWGQPPAIDLDTTANLLKCLSKLASLGLIRSARDISDGGLTVGLAESCFENGIGVQAAQQQADATPAAWHLFGESAGQILVTCARENLDNVRHIVEAGNGLISELIGWTGIGVGWESSNEFELSLSGVPVISASLSDLKQAWSNALQSTLSVDTVTA